MAGVIIGLGLAFFLAQELLPCASSLSIDRTQFPPDFLFGTSTSAYQIEGGYLEGNKGLSNWDIFTHTQGKVEDGTNGDTADDHYHRYMEDIELIHSLGVNSYRFSIAWARILPKGRFGHVNQDGVAFYNALIDALIQKGIEPFVTISHFDIPYELEKRYGGWLSPKIQSDFGYLADVCFRMFGDRVKFWITLNEPNIFTKLSCIYGRFPPGHCSKPFGNCTFGNSSTEPYIAGHNIVLSHANVVNIYKKKYQGKQGGRIGITVQSRWYEPFQNTSTDILAVERALSFGALWFLDPIILGDYPSEMRKILGPNLPEFTMKQKKILQASKLDFIGLNHYSTSYLKDCISSSSPCELDPFDGDAQISTSAERHGILIGEMTGSLYINTVPYGMEKVVMYFKTRYNNTPIYVTENVSSAGTGTPARLRALPPRRSSGASATRDLTKTPEGLTKATEGQDVPSPNKKFLRGNKLRTSVARPPPAHRRAPSKSLSLAVASGLRSGGPHCPSGGRGPSPRGRLDT